MSKTDSAFEAAADPLEARAAVAEALVAVGSAEDHVPRFITPPPANTPPIVVDEETAISEMAHFDTTPGRLVGAERNDPWPGPQLAPKPLTFNAVHLMGSAYHILECDGACGIPFGCAPQWQPDEIARMQAHGPKDVNFIRSSAKPALREKTSAERKGEPIHSGVLMYFPDALAAVARLSKAGNDKHNPGEPLHWARGKSTDQMDCQVRHSLTTTKIDPETKEMEAVAMVWRGLAELQLLEERRLVAAGIMPYSGVTS